MLLDVVDETIGAGIVTANYICATKFWLNDLGQLFAQLNTNKTMRIIIKDATRIS